jgi:putative oxidoreductase
VKPQTVFQPIAALLAPFAPLFLRLGVAYVFVRHGLMKVHMGLPQVAGFFGHLGIPIPTVWAAVVIGVETLGAACLALGLLTRFWALCMAVDMVVAIWRAVLPRAPELELLLLVGSLALLSLGAGPLSIDRLLQKKV